MKRSVIGIALFLLLHLVLVGQQNSTFFSKKAFPEQPAVESLLRTERTDSVQQVCKRVLQQANNLVQRGIATFYLGRSHFLELDEQEAIHCFEKANQFFRQATFEEGLALSYFELGLIAFYGGDMATAHTHFDQAMPFIRKLSNPHLLYDALENNAIAEYNSTGNSQASLQSLKEALKIATGLGDVAKIKSAYNQIATNYYSIGELDSATLYFEQLIEIKRELAHTGELISDLSMLGKLYQERGDYVKAQYYLIDALRQAEYTRDTHNIMNLYTDIAEVYMAQKVWDKALAHSQKGAALARRKHIQFIAAKNLQAQGFIFSQLDSIPQALDKYQQALLLYKELNNNVEAADIEMQMGSLYQSAHNYTAARRYLDEALALRNGTNDQMGLLNVQLMRAELEIKEEQGQRAIPILRQCLDLSTAMNHQEGLRKTYALLASAHAQREDFKSSYEALQQYNAINDSIRSTETTRVISELETHYETEKKDRAIAENQILIERKEAEIRRGRYQNIILLISISLVALLAIALFFIYQKNKQLHQQRIEMLQNAQEAQRLLAVVEGEEKERRRFGRELHDGLGALLASTKMRIDALQKELPHIKQLPVYQSAEQLIDHACQTVREISHDMMPRVIDQQGLEKAVEELCLTLSATQGLEVNFIPYGLDQYLDNRLSATVYRIIQELLRNVVKHAQASTVIVQITAENDFLSIVVEDDGCGFDPEDSSLQKGIGLDNVSSRVKLLGGHLTIDSEMGEGTTMNINIPIKRNLS